MGFQFFLHGDPGRAAEPGFDHQPPCGGGGVTIPIGDIFDILPELIEHLTENPLAGGSVKTKAAGRIMKDLAWREPAQAAQSSVIELMGDQFQIEGDGNFPVQALHLYNTTRKIYDQTPIEYLFLEECILGLIVIVIQGGNNLFPCKRIACVITSIVNHKSQSSRIIPDRIPF
jgi:hypothetical protein